MSNLKEHTVVAPDGRRWRARLRLGPDKDGLVEAPAWLLQRFGLTSHEGGWFLRPSAGGNGVSQTRVSAGEEKDFGESLCLVRTTVAAANRVPFDPRQTRLKKERARLRQLTLESDFVRVEELNVLAGSEPENYRVTFLCKGIIGIDSSRRPIYGEKHLVEILCDDDFPSDVPRLRWITDIWHPNIQHAQDKGVCVNKPEWLGGMGLNDLCRLMFEMVQYKNYHAAFTQPYPLDQDVARWVLEYAEPNGIVDKSRGITVDNKPFTRPTVTRYISLPPVPPPSEPRIRLVLSEPTPVPATSSRIKLVDSASSKNSEDPAQPFSTRIKIVNRNE